MADTRIEDHLPQDAGGFKFILVPVNPSDGTPVPRWQVGEVEVENSENTYVPYVMEKPAESGGQGQETVDVPETPQRIVGASVPCRAVIVQALPTNTDYVAVGMSNTVRAGPAGSEAGVQLAGGESVTLAVRDCYLVWIDAVVADEGVTFLYVV
jgi:hypothetical protein